MARFPQTEPEIVALALLMVQGLSEAGEDFPQPPVPPDQLQAKLDAFNAAAAAAAETVVRDHHAVKDEALDDLADSMKADLRYAEFAVKDRPERLTQIGWGPRRDGVALKPPGEVRDIRIMAEGDTWTILGWNPPVDGGAVGVSSDTQSYAVEEHPTLRTGSESRLGGSSFRCRG